MLMHITSVSVPHPHSLCELGIPTETNPIVSLSQLTYRKCNKIYGEKEPADYVYQVKSGAVRSFKLLRDSRRQIGAFYVSGDIFGLENGSLHRSTAEAVVDTTVRLIRRQNLDVISGSDGALAKHLLRMTTSNLKHAEDHMLLLGRKTSIERVAAFILEMDERLTDAGILALPMSRRDIADYLGLKLETVSRALSHLRKLGILGFIGATHRQIVLLDRQQLAGFDRQN